MGVAGRIAAAAPVAVALLGGAFVSVAATEPDATRQAQLTDLLRQDCGSCHGLTMKGGLGPALLPHALAGKDDAILIEAILDGRPGTPMPPWRFELSEADAAWMVAQLKSGTLP